MRRRAVRCSFRGHPFLAMGDQLSFNGLGFPVEPRFGPRSQCCLEPRRARCRRRTGRHRCYSRESGFGSWSGLRTCFRFSLDFCHPCLGIDWFGLKSALKCFELSFGLSSECSHHRRPEWRVSQDWRALRRRRQSGGSRCFLHAFVSIACCFWIQLHIVSIAPGAAFALTFLPLTRTFVVITARAAGFKHGSLSSGSCSSWYSSGFPDSPCFSFI